MKNNKNIRTTKIIYPQIYAYTLPTVPEKSGWIKIGYTERKNVDERIMEQTKTAAINLNYSKLWSEPAKYANSDEWFKDKSLHSYLRKYKNREQHPKTEWFYYNGNPENSLDDFNDFRKNKMSQIKEQTNYTLRPEQEKAVNKTLEYMINYPFGKFLWNAKPRFGKTLTTYDLVRKMDATKVLIVTNRPAIANSWFDDFEKFIAWQTKFSFVSTTQSLKNRKAMSHGEWVKQLKYENSNDRILAFVSLQDLKGSLYFGGIYDKLEWIKNLEWDLLVIDESHEGVDTLKTDFAFDKINRKFTLYLSGTPFKAIASGDFEEEQIYNWSYTDEQQSKNEWNNFEIHNPYEDMPKLNMFSFQMSELITKEVNKGARIEDENIDFTFDLNEFFETNDSGKFIHEKDVRKWLDTLTHNEKYPFSTKRLRDELKHTFWLLNRVASAKALKKLLNNHPVFENYEIILAAGNEKNQDDQLTNEKSFDKVRKAISQNEKTITLSVGQLTTGITIPEWTAVLMLSNIKSPSLYMQAAFRVQNPWEYQVKGDAFKKENAYVFDFAPERTLIMYDEFANNLLNKTTNGRGSLLSRQKNIQKLLNFFPVIAEDIDGKMIELDANQVLSIPKRIKSKEVVKRGFMSNLLFQNVSGIFASENAKEILEQLKPVDKGKSIPRQTKDPIDTNDVQLDDEGKAKVDSDLVIAKTNAVFGAKFYEDIFYKKDDNSLNEKHNISKQIANEYTRSTKDIIKNLAKENGLNNKVANQIVNKNANILAREIETAQENANIKSKKLEIEYQKKLAESNNNELEIKEIKENYFNRKKEIEEDLNKEINKTINHKSKELAKGTTETILQKAEEKKKVNVEDDVRARLRGFSRTIPSFLMAYGNDNTSLKTFDENISEDVFKEVTGITLSQFITLRDTYKFFDEVVFDESIKEFLEKRRELSDYFDESQDEDIFDYIPHQKTNQIYTPKKVVKMMIDKLEEESPQIFTDPNKTFVDLYMKSGLYITEIVKRLYKGLETQIPNNNERIKHILENQVYGFAPSEIIYNISKNYIFGFNDVAKTINDKHIVNFDTTPFARGEGNFEEKCKELFGGDK